MVELAALSSRNGRVIATFLNFDVSHGSTATCLRGGEKYYIFAADLLMFPPVKGFSNRLTVNEVIAKSSKPRFLQTQCQCH